jgi:hypothetical protein
MALGFNSKDVERLLGSPPPMSLLSRPPPCPLRLHNEVSIFLVVHMVIYIAICVVLHNLVRNIERMSLSRDYRTMFWWYMRNMVPFGYPHATSIVKVLL